MVLSFIYLVRTTVIASLLIPSCVSSALEQHAAANSSDTADKHMMQQDVSGIIHQAAKDATKKTPEGVTVTTTPLVSSEDIDKVKRFGNKAVPFLSGYIRESKDPLEQQVAVRLLGSLESDQALDELGSLAEQAQSPFVRSLTLPWLSSTRRDKDVLVLQRVSTSDPDLRVRTEATRLLKRKFKKDSSSYQQPGALGPGRIPLWLGPLNL
jgi:hypothetical protein